MREMDGLGSHTDVLGGHPDMPSIETDALIPIIAPETVSTHPTEPKPPDIPDSTANQTLNKSDGLRGHMDRSSTCTHVQSIAHKTETAANMSENIRMHQNCLKTPNLPSQSAKQLPYKPNSCGNCLDRLERQTDMQNGGNEMETPADEAETISICPVESKLPRSPTKGTNGCANETDRSSHHPGMLNMRTHTITPANEVGNIRTCQIKPKMPNSPAGSATLHSDEPNGRENHMDRLGTHTDGHSIKMHALTPRNKPQTVKMHPNNLKTRNSPNMAEIAMPRHSYQWRKVSIDGADVYTLLNMLINTPSQNFIFGRFEGRDELIAANVEGERVGNGVGNHDEWSSDMDGITSSGSADLKQVKAALLAANSQHTHYRSRAQGNSSPVLSKPPTDPTECPYGRIRCRHC